MAKSARMFQWLIITLFLLIGTGGYFWYRSEAGVKTSATPVPSEMSASGLVGYWTFDGADYSSATVITDKSGNSHSGTLTNTPTKTTGKWGQALDFPGTNQYVSVGTVYNGVKTVAFWVWADNTTKNIIDLNATATIDVSSGTVRGNNFTSPTIYIDGVASSTPTIDTTGWHFVVITTGTGINASAVDIGRISTGYFDGRLDDVRMYSSALSANAIYQLYTSGNAKINAPSEDPLSQSLRGYWKLDDGSGTNATDASGNGNTLAMTGSPSWATGQIGPYSLDFSGTAQYLSVADPASGVLDFGDGADFTISGWFNRDTAAADHTIVAKKNDQTTNAGYVVWIDNNGSTDYLSAEISDGTDTYSAIGTTDLSTTGWHQFSIVWDDSNGLSIYLDGKLDGSTTSSTASINSLANALAFRIGAESDAGVPFDGKIDDIRVYGYALSVDQVKKVYNTTSPTQPIDTSLVGHWTFDGNDIQGTTAIDRSSYGNNGTITGTTKTIGKLGQALSFNGSSDYINISENSQLPVYANSTALSISFWVKASASGSGVSENTIFSEGPVVSSSFPHFRLEDIGSSEIHVNLRNDSGGTDIDLYSTSGVFDDMWHHVVWVDNNGSAKLYVDGVQDATDFSYTRGTMTSLTQTGIGYQPEWIGAFFQGKLDDVRIYNRALSVSEVISLYNTGK